MIPGETAPQRVLVVGGGGREHALAWACARSPSVATVLCAPGNAGTGRIAQNCPVDPTDVSALVRLARDEDVGLVILGPDASVAAGVADGLVEAGIACFGPSRAAGRIESSKAFAKDLMLRVGIATPAHRTFSTAQAALEHLHDRDGGVVIKADGLARGKGAFVCDSPEQAVEVVERLMLRRELGGAGDTVVVEEVARGREVSLFAICDGVDAVMLPTAHDYKRAYEADLGANTGGMGSYAPDGPGWGELNRRALEEIVRPVLAELRNLGTPYRGCLYVGAMVDGDKLQVLEFNARFGDPEAEVILPLLSDPLPVMRLAAGGSLVDQPAAVPQAREEFSAGVVAVCDPYPEPSPTGAAIAGLEEAQREGALIFHMGTSGDPEARVSGGRVLISVGVAGDRQLARQRAYQGLRTINFPGMRYRRDIASG